MNVIKGIDRIALVLAFVAIIPGSYFGYQLYESEIKYIKTEEYHNWLKAQKLIEGLGIKTTYKIELEDDAGHKIELEDDLGIFDNPKINPSKEIKDNKKVDQKNKERKLMTAKEILESWKKEREDNYRKDILGKLRRAGFPDNQISELMKIMLKEEPKNKYLFPSSIWVTLSFIFITTSLSFFVTLYGIRLGVRAIKSISIWVVEGFKELS